jgi:hypothetical protein
LCKSGSLQPTRCHSGGILPIPSRATSSPFGICSVAIVNVKVTDSVICVFYAPFTFQRSNTDRGSLKYSSPTLVRGPENGKAQ